MMRGELLPFVSMVSVLPRGPATPLNKITLYFRQRLTYNNSSKSNF